MSFLGSVGQLYMLALLTLLFLGFGFAIWSAINNFAERSSKKEIMRKANSNVSSTNNQGQSIKQIFGGFSMANNGWLKLAIFSFVGILISFAVLGLLTSNGMTGGMTGIQGNMNNMQMPGNAMNNSNTHLQHQQSGMNTNGINNMQMAGMQGNMNMNNMPMAGIQMGNMQMPGMQGGMNMGNMNSMPINNMQMYGMQNGMNMPMGGMQMGNMPMNNMNMGGNDMMMMLQNMQMQMNQMQQQINMMNSSSMSNGSMSGGSMGGGSMGGSSGGGMGMMGGMM